MGFLCLDWIICFVIRNSSLLYSHGSFGLITSFFPSSKWGKVILWDSRMLVTLRQMPSWMSNKMGRLSFLTAEPMYHCIISGSTLAKIGRQSCKGPHGSVADVPQPSVPLSPARVCSTTVRDAPKASPVPASFGAWGSAPRTGASRDYFREKRQGHSYEEDRFV